jgi:hypothetical protein
MKKFKLNLIRIIKKFSLTIITMNKEVKYKFLIFNVFLNIYYLSTFYKFNKTSKIIYTVYIN